MGTLCVLYGFTTSGVAMHVQDKVVVITGGAGGIGTALGRRFVAEGARGVVLADLDGPAADGRGPIRGVACDAGDLGSVAALVADVETTEGPVDLFCSNAGIARGINIDDDDAAWQANWDVNLMSQVHAARVLLPGWLARGEGYLLVTASAAGLLTTLGDAAYAATKHASVGLAEWLSITYGDRGVRVSCLCPQGVRTTMVYNEEGAGHIGLEQVKALRIVEPDDLAESVVAGLAAERFLILTHEEVAAYQKAKSKDVDGWIGAMRHMQADLLTKFPDQEYLR
jgi:NAD(P)-dependent dehydrogenase (short-subunit alcohol dehydrogenase family)